jgi:hypothetical protein
MNREDVLGTLRQTYAGFGKLLEHFDKAQMKALLVHGNWAVKHILAHLASWEKLEIGWMEEVTAGRRPLLYTEGYEWDMIDREQQNELIHGYNARVLEECQERSLQDVLGELGDTQERMLDVVSRLPKAAFSDPNILFWVKLEVPRDPWTPLPVNSHEHYRDHANWLRAWAEKKG